MNHITQLNRLTEELQSLKDFMPICPMGKVKKLSYEMIKIKNRIEHIQTMGFDEMIKEVPFQYETKQSRINFVDFGKRENYKSVKI